MYKLHLKLSKPQISGHDIDLYWQVSETPPGMMWLKLLLQICRRGLPLFPRFTGFVSSEKTFSSLQEKLNHCIETINTDGRYYIKERAENHFDQEFSNAIHHHFEILRGVFEKPTSFYLESSDLVKRAILGLNHAIHDMEALHRSEEAKRINSISAAGVIVECVSASRYKLHNDFLPYFTLNIEFGDVVLHYSQIGKTWWEVYLDQDEEIFEEAICPLSNITGEFDVFFVKPPSQKNIDDFQKFLVSRGKDPADPSLALGFLPVAKFIKPEGLSEQGCLDLISAHLGLKEVNVLHGNTIIGTAHSDTSTYELNLPSEVTA